MGKVKSNKEIVMKKPPVSTFKLREEKGTDGRRITHKRKSSVRDLSFDVGQAAEYFGVSVKTMQRWDKDGRLEAHRTKGNRRFYLYSQLVKFDRELKNEQYEKAKKDAAIYASKYGLTEKQKETMLKISEKAIFGSNRVKEDLEKGAIVLESGEDW